MQRLPKGGLEGVTRHQPRMSEGGVSLITWAPCSQFRVLCQSVYWNRASESPKMNTAADTKAEQQTKGKVLAAHSKISSSRPNGDFASTEQLLRYLYEDLTRISQVVSADIILHRADRDLLQAGESEPVRGVDAVQAHQEALVAAARGTLRMEVESISANEHFGAVLGILHACSSASDHEGEVTGELLAMPFCGLWRFVDGVAVEHWENAADPARLREWLKRAASTNMT